MATNGANVLAEKDGLLLVAGATHTHSSMSDGQRSPEELIEMAARKGLGAICITDHHDDEWRYRWGVRIRRPSINTFGPGEYLARIQDLAATRSGPIVVAGVEIAPHYRWEGLPPFLRCLAMKTLVAFGVDDPEVIRTLPARLDGSGSDEAEAIRTAQAVIDHLRASGALVYWSHLEKDERNRFLTARLRNCPRPTLMEDTTGYTGFGCFPEGYREICVPGGAWDTLLARSAKSGKFDGPWTFGEADYHNGDAAAPARDLSNPVTVFTLRSLDAREVVQALALGSMYAYSGPRFRDSLLTTFRLTDPRSGAAAGAGGVLRTDAAPELEVRVSGFPKGRSIRAIVGGRVVTETPEGALKHTLPAPAGVAYACRIEVLGSDERIMSNPIFVAPGCPQLQPELAAGSTELMLARSDASPARSDASPARSDASLARSDASPARSDALPSRGFPAGRS